MRAKIRPILEECIELGVVRGLEKAHKHTDEPTHAHICDQIEIEIWSFIDERFEFERNVCNEVVEGFDQLEKEREWVGLTREEEAVVIEQWHMEKGKPSQLCRLIEAKLKEKNT